MPRSQLERNIRANEGKQLVAPSFFEVETDSILRQKVAVRKALTLEQARALRAEDKFPIR